MKKFLGYAAAVLALTAAGVGCSDNPNAPKPTTVVFTAQLSPANEVPPVTNGDANASGTATITFNNLTYRSSGEVEAGTVDFQVSLSGFPVATQVTGAHVHQGAPGIAGAIVIDTGLAAAGGMTLVTGSGTISRTGIAVDGDIVDALIANPAGYYFNVHTTANTGGAIRGQLVKQ